MGVNSFAIADSLLPVDGDCAARDVGSSPTDPIGIRIGFTCPMPRSRRGHSTPPAGRSAPTPSNF
ncbi:MAG: hypothetical protein WDN45_16235 [Caulobacteraceae bacterium]